MSNNGNKGLSKYLQNYHPRGGAATKHDNTGDRDAIYNDLVTKGRREALTHKSVNPFPPQTTSGRNHHFFGTPPTDTESTHPDPGPQPNPLDEVQKQLKVLIGQSGTGTQGLTNPNNEPPIPGMNNNNQVYGDSKLNIQQWPDAAGSTSQGAFRGYLTNEDATGFLKDMPAARDVLHKNDWSIDIDESSAQALEPFFEEFGIDPATLLTGNATQALFTINQDSNGRYVPTLTIVDKNGNTYTNGRVDRDYANLDKSLADGNYNEGVEKAQKKLQQLGFLDPNIEADGIYGEATREATEKFQMAQLAKQISNPENIAKLKQDGVIPDTPVTRSPQFEQALANPETAIQTIISNAIDKNLQEEDILKMFGLDIDGLLGNETQSLLFDNEDVNAGYKDSNKWDINIDKNKPGQTNQVNWYK